MRAPVAIIIFNRPAITARLLAELRRVRPAQLFVIADGARADRPGEREKCAATRAVIDQIDWDCRVVKKYSDVNLGCGRGPAEGLDWVFTQTDRAIILEDDCLAHPSFFPYCDELLERYRDDERIAQIAGSNFQCGRRRGPGSYFFSRFKICWGWATWRRAWQHMDMRVSKWPELRDTNWLTDRVGDSRAAHYWAGKIEAAHRAGGRIDYWDYQWLFATWVQNGLCIMPNVNLISNIGFGADATHTTWTENKWAQLAVEAMPFPLQHPPTVERDPAADEFFIREVVYPNLPKPVSFGRRAVDRVRHAYAAAVPAGARAFVRQLRSRS